MAHGRRARTMDNSLLPVRFGTRRDATTVDAGLLDDGPTTRWEGRSGAQFGLVPEILESSLHRNSYPSLPSTLRPTSRLHKELSSECQSSVSKSVVACDVRVRTATDPHALQPLRGVADLMVHSANLAFFRPMRVLRGDNPPHANTTWKLIL
jgi:hypothetical protein